jgi:curved DNA-binding protein CbpA
MKDYYEIMKVDRRATDGEIKKAFRKLANQYHPDKNPSREANTIFQEINEAYEVLSDPASRLEYDQRIANPGFYNYQTSRPSQPRPNYRRGPSEKTMLQNSMLRYSRLLFYFGCLWCSVLAVDYLMPEDHLTGKVTTDLSNNTLLSTHQPKHLLNTDLGHSFNVTASEMRHFPVQTDVHIYRSQLLAAMIRVENHDGTFIVNNLGTIYRNFSFAPILLFLGCMIGIIVKKGAEFHMNLGIVVFLLMILNIVLLFSSQL